MMEAETAQSVVHVHVAVVEVVHVEVEVETVEVETAQSVVHDVEVVQQAEVLFAESESAHPEPAEFVWAPNAWHSGGRVLRLCRQATSGRPCSRRDWPESLRRSHTSCSHRESLVGEPQRWTARLKAT